MSAQLRAFLLDDEPLALRGLARMLTDTGRVDVVGQATDPRRALAELRERQDVDVLFLDIHMPGLDGFEVLETLPVRPRVVFTTAHDEHAIRAFEVNALDYLLKPVEPERLARTLDRLEQRGREPLSPMLGAVLEQLGAYLRRAHAPYLERVSGRHGDAVHVVSVASITHFVIRDGLTRAVTADGETVVDQPLAVLERRLDPRHFVRVSRNALVNLAFVHRLEGHLGGRVRLHLRGGGELVVARDRVRALKERLGL